MCDHSSIHFPKIFFLRSIALDSDEPPARVAQLIKMAEATCFTIAALRNPAPVALEATVNGRPFDLALAGSA